MEPKPDGSRIISVPFREVASGRLHGLRSCLTMHDRIRVAREEEHPEGCEWCEVSPTNQGEYLVGALWHINKRYRKVEYWLGTVHCDDCSRASAILEKWLSNSGNFLVDADDWRDFIIDGAWPHLEHQHVIESEQPQTPPCTLSIDDLWVKINSRAFAPEETPTFSATSADWEGIFGI